MTAADIAAGQHGRRCGNGWLALCPVHEGDGKPHKPSLSIRESGGKVLVCCRAGCAQDAVIAALRALGLWPERERRQWTRAERAQWATRKRELERDLRPACLWQRAAVIDTEEALNLSKSAFFDSTAEVQPSGAELQTLTRELARLEQLTGAALVATYRHHRQVDPLRAAHMVEWAHMREQAERAAVLRYIREISE